MSLLVKCTCHCDDRNECVVAEEGKKYTLYNASKVIIRKIKVDGCFPQPANEKRCDYLMTVESMRRAIFIELKGAGLARAVRQLHSTILLIKKELQGYQIDARIVGNGSVPKLKITPDYRNLAKEVISTKGTIGIRTNFYPETI